MTTDPGDLVLDPTCGSGTTAYVAEQWGRRWITIDTSRVALALAPRAGHGRALPVVPPRRQPRRPAQGSRNYPPRPRRNPDRWRRPAGLRLCPRPARHPQIHRQQRRNRHRLGGPRKTRWSRCAPPSTQRRASPGRNGRSRARPARTGRDDAKTAHAAWWEARIARQREIDAAIAAKADTEYLYDKPYEDKARARVAGPFTVESLAPHRMLAVDEDGERLPHPRRRRRPLRRVAGLRPGPSSTICASPASSRRIARTA